MPRWDLETGEKKQVFLEKQKFRENEEVHAMEVDVHCESVVTGGNGGCIKVCF